MISSTKAPSPRSRCNPAAEGAAKIQVDYSPTVSPAAKAAKAAEKVKVRPVVSINKERSHPCRERVSPRGSAQHGPFPR